MWRYIHDNTKFWTPLSKVFTSTLSLYRSVYKTISYSPIDSYLHLTIQQSLNGDQINICSIKMTTGKRKRPGGRWEEVLRSARAATDSLPDQWHRLSETEAWPSLLMVLFGHKQRLVQCLKVKFLWKPLANHMQSWVWHHPSQASGIWTQIDSISVTHKHKNGAFPTWSAL